MATPVILSSDSVNNMSIALIDADQEVDATTDYAYQTDAFSGGNDAQAQQRFFASAKSIVVELVCNSVTGTPSVTAIAEVTHSTAEERDSTGITWLEIGRAAMTASGSGALPLGANIFCSPTGGKVKRLRVRFDSTGGTLSGSHKFTLNYTEKDNGTGVKLAPCAIHILG